MADEIVNKGQGAWADQRDVTVTRAQFKSDPGRFFSTARNTPVRVLNSDGSVGMTIYTPKQSHYVDAD